VKAQTRANYCRTQNDYFGEALKQWASMKPKSKQHYLRKAADPENRTLKNAKMVLELGAQEAEASR